MMNDNGLINDESEKCSDALNTTKITEINNHPEWVDILGTASLMKKILIEGRPNCRPQHGQLCHLNYKLFHESKLIEEENDFIVQLGDCEVIQGLDLALSLTNVGEHCLIKIISRLAFGRVGLVDKVPPNADVLYEIKLLNIEDCLDVEEMSLSQRKHIGQRKKVRGNWWFSRQEWSLAIRCYRRALDFLDHVDHVNSSSYTEEHDAIGDNALQGLFDERISVYNNMAATQIKLEQYDVAQNSLNRVLACQPNNVKALYRQAKVHRAKNEYSSALACLRKANNIEPDNQDVRNQIILVNKVLQKQKLDERNIAKRMFAKVSTDASKLGNKKKNATDRPNYLIWGTVAAAGVAIGLAGFGLYLH